MLLPGRVTVADQLELRQPKHHARQLGGGHRERPAQARTNMAEMCRVAAGGRGGGQGDCGRGDMVRG
jgi:hypothetical protein